MAEFVEFSLERLLPVFENLKVSKLFTAVEVDDLIRRFRRYEYMLSKRTKESKDYHDYADFILDVLATVKERRKKERYFNRSEHIEKQLKYKGACLHQFCVDRFKDESIFRKQIDYLLKINLLGKLSEAYTKLLQFYGQNPRYYEEAGCFEFFKNRSAENARVILHGALRKFPHDVGLWAALFEVEVGYAKFILRRVERLQGVSTAAKKRKRNASSSSSADDENSQKDEKAKDAISSSPRDKDALLPNGQSADGILALRLAEVVCTQACESLPKDRHAEFLYRAWRLAAAAGDLATEKAAALFESLAKITPPTEEFTLAKCERDEKVSQYDLYDLAVEKTRTERMIRMYIDFCDSRASNDVFASVKMAELFGELDALGVATSADYDRLFALIRDDASAASLDASRYERILRHALEKTPQNARLWERLIAARISALIASCEADSFEDAPQFAEVKALVDEALSKIPAAESLGVWRQLLELACAICGSPKKLERIFSRAFSSATPKVAAELRTIRFEYVAASGDDSYRAAYKQMANVRPTALSLHFKFVEVEESRGGDGTAAESKKLIESALENALLEFGANSAECWLKYLEFALTNSPKKSAKFTRER